ncbi:MAG: glycosyltransferase family 1 protein [Oscillospiraceae bacterium]|nr:glycosyltransferase family 1 protein [Oscillospiraceae bacterium]
MIRILHIVSYMQRGGLETLIMNCYRHIDREKMQFDFIVHRPFRADYDDEIEALGGKIYRLPRLNPFSHGYKKALLDFFKAHPEYRIVHCHLDCMSALPLKAAMRCGAPVRIAHAHNSNQDKDWKYPLKRWFMRDIPDVATHFFACSKESGEWMFPGQVVTIVNNGIETERFGFSPEVRSQVRGELGIKEELILGHVGRIVPQKNHDFLIEIFAEVAKQSPDAKLLLIGAGPLEEQVRRKVNDLGLTEHVRFLGIRSDVNRILQAVDVFVLPSLYEGLSLTAVEAQTSGVTCVFSDSISRECEMTDLVEFVSLNETPAHWADMILKGSTAPRKDQRDKIIEAGYDIQTTADWLVDFYTAWENN